ncbi:MAG: hypothetical protein IJM31_08750, partial [Campylobacter sp.]|nr:hypothetical protein [Campylobacter sp.]
VKISLRETLLSSLARFLLHNSKNISKILRLSFFYFLNFKLPNFKFVAKSFKFKFANPTFNLQICFISNCPVAGFLSLFLVKI